MPEPTHADTAGAGSVLQVLLAEQKHIDTQIETMMDLQIKVLAILFPALAAIAGWVFGTDEKHLLSCDAKGEVLLVIIAVMCFGILLSVICYNLAAEYSRYKAEVLGLHLGRLLNYTNPLDGRGWGQSTIGHTLMFAIAGLWVTISTALCIALVEATQLLWATTSHHGPTLRTSLCLAYAISVVSLLSVVLSLSTGARDAFGRLLAARRRHS
jgi:hypothetical protein